MLNSKRRATVKFQMYDLENEGQDHNDLANIPRSNVTREYSDVCQQ